MQFDTSRICHHYSQPDLITKLLSALERAGKDIDSLSRDDVAGFEEFHIRGRDATRELARLADLQPEMEVLDIGCGIGGPAHTLAAEFGCRVTGLDLVEEYCRAATALTNRLGLAERVKFQEGDALGMPFFDDSFDAAFMAHVSMNIEDKTSLFREVARVLRPEGRLALYEICAGAASPPHFPAPWAADAHMSFLATPEELRAQAEASGFTSVAWKDVSGESFEWFRSLLAAMAARPKDAPPPLGLNLLMGPDTPQKAANVIRNLEEDRIRVVQAVFTHSAPGAT